MKRFLLLTCLLALWGSAAASIWNTHTNTSHVYDLLYDNNQLYFSTWGGVVRLGDLGSPPSPISLAYASQNGIWTTADGLVSNDIRNIAYIDFSNSLWLGSEYNGITIVTQQGVQKLDTSLGLPSNRVKQIIEDQAKIYVATYNGVAEYYYLQGVNYPLLLHQYNTQNTSNGLPSNEIDAMALSSERYLYLGTSSGVTYVHLDSLEIDSAWKSLSTPFTIGEIIKMKISQDKLVLVTANTVLIRSADPTQSGWTFYHNNNALQNETLSDAAIDATGRLWVSYGLWNENFMYYTRNTDYLMSSIDAQGVVTHFAENENGLLEKSISRLFTIGNDVFAGSWGNGIYHLEYGTWQQFVPNSIGFPKVRQIVTDKLHAAWFANGDLNHLPLRKSSLGASRWSNEIWQTFTIANSPIQSDNTVTIGVDSRNRKWFGTYDVVANQSPPGWDFGITIWDDSEDIWKKMTHLGIRDYDPETQTWSSPIPGSPTLLGNTITHITTDQNNNVMISCYDRGMVFLTPNDEALASFQIPNSVNQRIIYSFHNGRQYFFGTYNDRGLVIWNHNSIPVTNGEHWVIPAPQELSNCEVYGVVTINSPYEGVQHWIAVSNGLYMWNEQYWYRYDTTIKRFRYNTSTLGWDDDLLYYADEERLYGSVRTTPTAIYLDPFGRIWIGSLAGGISMYNPKTERFTNYFQANSPLLSNYITALSYEPVNGYLLIGTPDGLNTLKVGRWIKPQTALQNVNAFPNPFRPDIDITVEIANLPVDSMPPGTTKCRIYDAGGSLVADLVENEFSRFAWNGSNLAGKKCGSGTYFFVITDAEGNIKRGKIVLIR